MWFGANCQITIVLTGGAAIFLGLSLAWTVVALVIGLAVGGLFMAFHSAQGPHLGLPQMIQSRAQFGFFGANLPLVITVAMYLGFYAGGAVLGGGALADITGVSLEWGIVLVGGGSLLLVLLGYRAIHLFEKIMTVWGLIVFVLLTIGLFVSAGDSAIVSPEGVGDSAGFVLGPFLLVVALAAVLLLSYAPYVADYSRYLPANTTVRSTFWYTYSGAIGSSLWLMIMGAVLQNRYPNLGVVDQVGHIADQWGAAFRVLVMVTIIIGIVGINALNTYGAFMSSATIVTSFFRKWKPSRHFRLFYIVPIVAFATCLAFLQMSNLLDSWQVFLGFLLYFLIPWTAVNLADYYFVRRGRYAVTEMFDPSGPYGRWNAAGLVSYFAGCLAQIPFLSTSFYTGPAAEWFDGGDVSWIFGIAVSGLLYILLASRRQNATVEPDAKVEE